MTRRATRRGTTIGLSVLAALFALLAPAIALAAGTGTAGDPFTRLGNAYKVTSAGRYWFNLGSGAFQADVDPAESGGWLLVLQYLHRGGTNPALAIKAAGAALPVTSTAALGTDESADATRWGHAGNAAMAQFTGDIELRWYGQTSAHTRIIHFRSTVGDAYVRTGTGDFAGINTVFTALTGHNAGLPAALGALFSNQGNLALTEFPFYAGASRHWGIHGLGNRWEVDDYPNGPAYHTIHRVWVRDAVAISAANDNFSGAPINRTTGGTTATVFSNDVLYGDPPDATNVTATITANGGLAGAAINANGTISVPAGAAVGTYFVTYQICIAAAPASCATAIATIAVDYDDDGDGTYKTTDIDDDDDGITDGAEGRAGFVRYEFYDSAPASGLTADIPTSGALSTGFINHLDPFVLQNSVDPGDVNDMSVRYTGYFNATTAGTHVFTVYSDDGGRIVIDGTPVATNDGYHPASTVSGSVVLTAGWHTIEIDYFQGGGSRAFSLAFTPPGGSSQAIPMTRLSSPFDTDGDGRADEDDLDSDNDGVTDNVEAQTTSAYVAPTGGFGTNGLRTIYGAGLTPVDSDSDGTADFRDANADNDGVADIAERGDSQPTTLTSTTDSDGDGLVDIFEGGSPADGFDANDQNVDGSGNFNLADSDNDTAANGAGAVPLTADLDYRDVTLITAAADNFSTVPINSASGGTTATVFTNDRIDGAVFAASAVTPSLTANGGITGLTITGAGQLVVPAGTAAGTYTPTYRICAVVSPTACATATATIVVAGAAAPGTGCTGTNLATNGSFESPVVASGVTQVPNGSAPGWSTNDSSFEYWTSGTLGYASFAGNQFIEMNAFIANTVITKSPAAIHGRAELRAFWAHRGRDTNNTANLVLHDSTGASTNFGNFTTGSSAWVRRTATHVAAANATTGWVVLSSVGSTAGVGNLLDDVQLCQTYVTIGKALLSRTDVDSSGDDSVGDTLTYRFTIANPAGNNSALNAVTVTDNRIGAVTANVPTSGDTNTNGFLDPGETWLVDAAYTLTAADITARSVTNSAFASGFTGANTIRSDDAVLTTPLTVLRLAIVKSADPTSLAGNVPAGHVVTYSYAVTNQGNVALTAITIADAHNGLGTPPVPGGETLTQDVAPTGDSTDAAQNGSWDTLGPGDTVTFTAGYTITQNDVDQRQ